jgi:NAD-dependent DNA ligase
VRDEQVHLTLEAYVNQFVLSMDVKTPSAADIQEFLRRQPLWTGNNVVFAGRIPEASKAAIAAILTRMGATLQEDIDDLTLYLIEGRGVKEEHAKVQEAISRKIERIAAEQFVEQFDTTAVENINADGDVGSNDKPSTTSK